MVWIDYIIIAIISFSTLVSSIRGFVRESLSLITLSCAFFISIKFYPYMATHLTSFNDMLIRNGIAILILFTSILIIGAIVNYMISSLVERTALSSTDRLLGICFGIFRGILIASIILFFLNTFTPLPKTENWQHSELIPKFNSMIKLVLNFLKNASSSY